MNKLTDGRHKGPATGLVYSTDTGRMCPTCRRAVGDCTCKRLPVIPVTDGIVRVSHETKGRKGKGVTVIKGVPLASDALATLAKQLKTACGSGGTAKDGVVEIQGDHRETVIAALVRQGHVVKRAGG